MHICVSNITNTGSDNGLSPVRRQDNVRTTAGIIIIEPLETKLQWNFNRNWNIFILENVYENVVWNIAAISHEEKPVDHMQWQIWLDVA